ncbi:MAG: PAS domain-containing protein [Planctomycetia bacterium]|nr:PAS domain-containing protein [Planctomycetia bacterium]
MVPTPLILLTCFLFALVVALSCVLIRLRYQLKRCNQKGNENVPEALLSMQARDEIFQMILDCVPICILVKDVENGCRHILWNKELERHTGITESEIIGKSDDEIEPWPGLGPFIKRLDEEAIRRGCVRQDALCPTATGKNIYYRTNKLYVKTRDGNSYIVDACINLTDEWKLRQQNAAIIENQQMLISKYELLSDCLAEVTKGLDWRKSVDYILARFGEAENAVHVYIAFYDNPADPNFALIDSNWSCKGSSPLPKDIDRIALHKGTRFWDELITEQKLVSVNQDDITVETTFKEWHRENSVGFVVLLPLFYRDRAFGLIGMNYREPQQVLSQSREFVMRNIAHFVELAYARKMTLGAMHTHVAESSVPPVPTALSGSGELSENQGEEA